MFKDDYIAGTIIKVYELIGQYNYVQHRELLYPKKKEMKYGGSLSFVVKSGP